MSCDMIDGGVGCCDSNGTLWFCDTLQEIISQTCVGGDVCGWNPEYGFYDCVPPPGGADPSNNFPMACGF